MLNQRYLLVMVLLFGDLAVWPFGGFAVFGVDDSTFSTVITKSERTR